MMNKEKLINKWQIDIANCEQIINHCSVTEKTMEFTKGELNAISDCLKELKNLTIPVVRQRFSKIPKDAEVIIKWTDDKAEQHEVKYNENEIENAEIHIGLMTGNICEGDLEP